MCEIEVLASTSEICEGNGFGIEINIEYFAAMHVIIVKHKEFMQRKLLNFCQNWVEQLSRKSH